MLQIESLVSDIVGAKFRAGGLSRGCCLLFTLEYDYVCIIIYLFICFFFVVLGEVFFVSCFVLFKLHYIES